MESNATQVAGKFIEQGLLGSAVVALVIALCLCIRHIVFLYKDKDTVRLQQISDVKIALEAVAKSTDNLNNAEERMAENNIATKELLAVTRALQNKGQV